MEERTRLQRHQSSTTPVSIFAPSSMTERAGQSADVMRSPGGVPAVGHDFSRISILPPEPGTTNHHETDSLDLQLQRSTEGVARSSLMPTRGHDFSQVSVLPVQRKLTVGQPNDPYEQEADRVADQVMRMPEPSVAPVGERIDRKCKDCEEEQEELVQTKSIVQRSGNGDLQVDEDLESRLNRSKGGGSPLPSEVQSYMEPRFGVDFSQVRVHTDSNAVQMAQSLNAQAFTHQQDVYFGAGRTPGNNNLTAHELAHVVQQSISLKTKQPLETQQDESIAQRKTINNRLFLSPNPQTGQVIQRAEAEGGGAAESDAISMSWAQGQPFPAAIELPTDEAARRVNQALDIMGAGMTYIRRPPAAPEAVASTDGNASDDTVQTFPDTRIQRSGSGSSRLEKVHGGVVGSIQVCWDCLTGHAELKGWIWAGVGYDSPIGWLGGYYFGEQTWWQGDLGKWFNPGTCDTACDSNSHAMSESGFGIAGFPVHIKPKERASFSKAGLEGGFLLTPHSYCDADIELIALINLLSYLGPIAGVVTKAVDGINAVTRGSPEVELQAGIDVSATFHLCRGADSLLAVNRAKFCGGGYVEGGVGLSHDKAGNHGAA